MAMVVVVDMKREKKTFVPCYVLGLSEPGEGG
jgi:hypothetical protein